jgi:hypothetical protein
MELAKQEGEIMINRLGVANRRFDLAKKDDSLANPTDEFKADSNQEQAARPLTIWPIQNTPSTVTARTISAFASPFPRESASRP